MVHLPERCQYSIFNARRRRQRLHLARQLLKAACERALISQSQTTLRALFKMLKGLLAIVRFNLIQTAVARQVVHNFRNALTVHAKHLADFVLAVAASSSAAGRSFSINSARPRCSRERTVRTAQPRIAARSAHR